MTETTTPDHYLVEIEHVPTGERRVWIDSYKWAWDDRDIYVWKDGNYSCDCNRHLFWLWANGEEEPDTGVRCGHHEFRVVTITNQAGEVLYSESAQ